MSQRNKKARPIHPGEMLKEDFLAPLGLSANKRPHEWQTSSRGRRAITADTALRLGRYFGTSAGFWLNIRARYDLDLAEDADAEEIERYVHPRTATAHA